MAKQLQPGEAIVISADELPDAPPNDMLALAMADVRLALLRYFPSLNGLILVVGSAPPADMPEAPDGSNNTAAHLMSCGIFKGKRATVESLAAMLNAIGGAP